MNKTLLKMIFMTFIALVFSACFEEGVKKSQERVIENENPDNQDSINSNKTKSDIDNATVKLVKEFDINSIAHQVANLSKDNYNEVVNIVTDKIKIHSVPNLKYISDLTDSRELTDQTRASTTNVCLHGGTYTLKKDLADRGSIVAKYFSGDEYNSIFNRCNIRGTIQNGNIFMRVDNFDRFDFSLSKDGDPMGKFITSYSGYTIETDSSLLSMDGSLIYEAWVDYSVPENSTLDNLTKIYRADNLEISAKSDKDISLIYNGKLEETNFQKKSDNKGLQYCTSIDFEVKILVQNEVVNRVNIKTGSDTICGDVVQTSSGVELIPTSGYIEIDIDGKKVKTNYLGDGTVENLYDENGDGIAEDISVNSSPENINEDNDSKKSVYRYKNVEGLDIVETTFFNESGNIDISEYIFPANSTILEYRSFYKSPFYPEELVDTIKESLTVNSSTIIDNQYGSTYTINDKTISILEYDENESGDTIKSRDVSIGRFYDIGSTLFEIKTEGSYKYQQANIYTEFYAVCKIDNRLNNFYHAKGFSYSGDIVSIRCDYKGSYTTVENGQNENKIINFTSYEYLKKGVGSIATIDEGCIQDGSFFMNNTPDCEKNSYDYEFLVE